MPVMAANADRLSETMLDQEETAEPAASTPNKRRSGRGTTRRPRTRRPPPAEPEPADPTAAVEDPARPAGCSPAG